MFLFYENVAALLLIALALDAIIGDPPALWERIPHPVMMAGRLIGWLDRWLNREPKRRNGHIAVGILVLISGVAGAVLHWLFVSFPFAVLFEILIVAILLSQRSLYDHVNNVALAFREGGLGAARDAVSLIVGRDPDKLDEVGICRAAIETTAENYSDGIVAPAFWYLIAGLPGIMIYKAVNTADSMIGHKNDRYEEFGWAAARLDDGMNYVPARLSALFIWIASLMPGYDHRSAAKAALQDAPLHRSVNAGWPEAAMAGALGLALAGPRYYESGKVMDVWMNKRGSRKARREDIRLALSFFVNACYVHAAFVGVIAVLMLF